MKRVLVIGASRGESSIGEALAASGHRVFLADPFAQHGEQSGGAVDAAAIDLSDHCAVHGVVEDAIGRLGGLDVLIFAAANDAAFFAGQHRQGDGLSVEDWERPIDRLLYGGFYATQAALRHMISLQSGQIVYLCADNAVDGQMLDPGIGAATCGLLALGSSLAASAFRNGVTINAIVAGTPFPAMSAVPEMPPEPDDAGIAYIPKAAFPVLRQRALHALGSRSGVGWPQTVAAMIGHLCAEEGRMIAGATLRLTNVSKGPPWIRWTY